jgi:hypothetical protein
MRRVLRLIISATILLASCSLRAETGSGADAGLLNCPDRAGSRCILRVAFRWLAMFALPLALTCDAICGVNLAFYPSELHHDVLAEGQSGDLSGQLNDRFLKDVIEVSRH